MTQGMGKDRRNKKGKVEVVDFNRERERRLEDKRRKTERIFFKQLLGIYCVTGNDEMKQIELVDISEHGCAFQVPFDPDNPWFKNRKEVPVRLYFSQETYLPVNLLIKNSRPYIEDGISYIRYGCEIDDSVSSYEAYRNLVRFMVSYSEHSHRDDGGISFFYL